MVFIACSTLWCRFPKCKRAGITNLCFGFHLLFFFSEEVEKWRAPDPISLMDEKWGAHDSFFLSSLTWMVANWGDELPGFIVSSHALICFKLFRMYLFVNGMASMGSDGILVVCSDGLIGYDDAYS